MADQERDAYEKIVEELAALEVTYDNEADALYVKLRSGDVATTREIDSHTLVDIDSSGRLLGIEVIHPALSAGRQIVEVRAERDRLARELETMTKVARSNKEHVRYLMEYSERLAETIRRHQPVIEAATAWHAAGWNTWAGDPARVLSDAIEVLEDVAAAAFDDASTGKPTWEEAAANEGADD